MALKDLSSAQMLALSTSWLDPRQGRPLLQAHTRAAAFLDDLSEAHAGLQQAMAPTADPGDGEIAALLHQAQEADRRHDNQGQGVLAFLTALSLLEADTPRAADYRTLRDLLAPEGARFVTLTYTEEARNASQVRARLASHPAQAALLDRIALPHGGTLAGAVAAWLDAGDELGKLEARRAELTRLADTRRRAPATDMLQARTRWVRAVQALEGALALRPELLSPGLQRFVLGPLRAALTPDSADDGDNLGDGSV